jgi:hypothetical protein
MWEIVWMASLALVSLLRDRRPRLFNNRPVHLRLDLAARRSLDRTTNRLRDLLHRPLLDYAVDLHLPAAVAPEVYGVAVCGEQYLAIGIAVGCVAFARPLFVNLGVDRGVTLLGGFSVAGIMGTTAVYVFGKRLRARSKFAES